MIDKTISHYKILEKLGEGGMGVVYKAEDTKLKRTVALKFLPPELTRDSEAKARFLHEAQAAAALSHPNICTVHEIDEADGQIFIATECIEGKTLKEKIASGPMKIDEALSTVIQVAEGLQEAHERGIVHRDIKSANVMVTSKGQAKIMDFGLAKLAGGTKLTKTGTKVGTIAYMSPEQARGEEVDHRSDVWSLGVILYEMLTGQLPFKGDYGEAVVYCILNEEPEPITAVRTGVPMELERIIDKALQKGVRTRYQGAAEVLADLRRIRDEETGVGLEARSPKKLTLRSAALAGVAAVVAFVAYVLVTQLAPRGGVDISPLGEKSIAVLPFKNMVPDPENEWFSDGLTEDIITQLAKIGELKVISRTSVMLYKDSDKSLRQIGEELGVAAILEGSVRRSGNRIRVVGQLIDARTDEHIWAETYDREMKDIFAIQSDVAIQIAAALKTSLSPGQRELIQRKPTENLTAYEYYLRGRDYYSRYRKQDNENAIELFKNALELDPNYAMAYAGLGDAYGQGVGKFQFASVWLDSAIKACQRAISIDPNCAEAYKALGVSYLVKGWFRKALEANLTALELNENYEPAMANAGWAHLSMGELDEALKWIRRAVSRNPSTPYLYCLVGAVHSALKDYDEAELWLRKSVDLQPDLSFAYDALIEVYVEQDEYDQARACARKHLSITANKPFGLDRVGDVEFFSGNYAQAMKYYEEARELASGELTTSTSPSHIINLAYLYWKMGRQDEAREIFAEYLRAAQGWVEEGNESHYIRYRIASINAAQGNKEKAYVWLQRAIDAGWRNYSKVSIDPLFENLHDDEQFKQIMAEVKGMVDEMRKRVEKAEERVDSG
ncbi:MAG: protein kinase [Candidatus Eiseniibacteriota bacterium]|nr:MAG: protein kinase [Candidatus Eisenbacteria bacterium]